MNFKPILFSTEMVRAILDGRKTQTRRLVKLKHLKMEEVGAIHPDGSGKGWIAWSPGKGITAELTQSVYPGNEGFACPYGQVGDVLWVREAFYSVAPEYDYALSTEKPIYPGETWYKADDPAKGPWKPGIHMPKSACRIFLEITDRRIERVQDISEEDAVCEGVWLDHSVSPTGYTVYGMPHWPTAREAFKVLWSGINGEPSWEQSPWIWCITFKRIDKPSTFGI
jgi:hypothetical protein